MNTGCLQPVTAVRPSASPPTNFFQFQRIVVTPLEQTAPASRTTAAPLRTSRRRRLRWPPPAQSRRPPNRRCYTVDRQGRRSNSADFAGCVEGKGGNEVCRKDQAESRKNDSSCASLSVLAVPSGREGARCAVGRGACQERVPTLARARGGAS